MRDDNTAAKPEAPPLILPAGLWCRAQPKIAELILCGLVTRGDTSVRLIPVDRSRTVLIEASLDLGAVVHAARLPPARAGACIRMPIKMRLSVARAAWLAVVSIKDLARIGVELHVVSDVHADLALAKLERAMSLSPRSLEIKPKAGWNGYLGSPGTAR